MNLSYLKYDFKGEMKKRYFTWKELLFALKNKIVKTKDVIDYAIYMLDEGIDGFDIILEITSLNADEDIYSYMEELCKLEEIQKEQDIKDKWLYLILKWLYENRCANSLEIVEEIYESFDYPQTIVSFVRYMPSETGDLGSLELNRKKLFNNWKDYLCTYEEENFIE